MAPVMVCVVETGNSSQVAMTASLRRRFPRKTACIARQPCDPQAHGCATIRQPPIRVPRAIAACTTAPPAERHRKMRAEVPLRIKQHRNDAHGLFVHRCRHGPAEYSDAETNCRMRKARSTANGVERYRRDETIADQHPSPARNRPAAHSTDGEQTVFDSPLQTATEIPRLGHASPDQSSDQGMRLEDGIPIPM